MPSGCFRGLRVLSLLLMLLGDVTANPIATTRRQSSSYTALGCQTDLSGGVRAISAAALARNDMTVEKCAAFCSQFAYFGVEYEDECYCGNAINPSSTQVNETECSFACAGNSSEQCGAGARINLYRNNGYQAATPAHVSAYPYLGCFVDTGTRVLPDLATGADDMTAAKCAVHCEGYAFFGTEWSRECYCGNQAPPQAAPDAECNMPCAGDNLEFRGADMRLTMYKFASDSGPPDAQSTHPDVDGFAYDGCYTDAAPRVLQGKAGFDNAMTPAVYAALCADYTFFGVEYSAECYCGTTLDSVSEKRPEDECTMPCGGNSSLSCGGPLRLNVYKKAESSAPGNLAKVGAFRYQSCWEDSVYARVLTGPSDATDDMTIEKCAAFCADYGFFGLVYSRECYCGDQVADQAASEGDCAMICSGDMGKLCGGPNRLNLYVKGGLPSASTMTTTSETETTVSSTWTVSPTTAMPATTSTTSAAPVITTVTVCQPSATYNGVPQSCLASIPDPCSSLPDTNVNGGALYTSYSAGYSDYFLGTPGFLAATACIPFGLSASTNMPNVRTMCPCLQSLSGLHCSYRRLCATAAYTVGVDTIPTALPEDPPQLNVNLLTNPSFEQVASGTVLPAGWTHSSSQITGGTTAGLSSDRAQSGSLAFRLVWDNPTPPKHAKVEFDQTVAVYPGARYEAAVWWQHANAGAQCTVVFDAGTVQGASAGGAMAQTLQGQPANVWTRFARTFTAPAPALTVKVSVSCGYVAGDGQDTVWIDSLSLVRIA